MHYHYQKPHPLLSEDVRTVLILDVGEPDDGKVPLFTNSMPALYCRTAKGPTGIERTLQLTLFGKSTSGDNWEAKPNETAIAFFFKPFALASMFNVSAVDLMKAPMDLDTWDVHKTNALKTQLAYAGTARQKVEALESLLIHQAQEQKTICEIIRKATEKLMQSSGKAILSELLVDLKLNERTFQRMFKKYVGITPGLFRRICQFQLSFTQVRTGEFDHLTDVAFDNGFADQSHFIRSFKEFTQLTPRDYVKTGLKSKK